MQTQAEKEDIDETVQLWSALSGVTPTAALEDIITGTKKVDILTKAKDALNRNAVKDLGDILSGTSAHYLVVGRIADYAHTHDKLGMLFESIDCTKDKEGMQISIGNYVSEAFKTDFDKTLTAVKKIPQLSNSEIVLLSYIGLSENGVYKKSPEFKKWITLQHTSLTRAERSELDIRDVATLAWAVGLKELQEAPTLLEFKEVPDKLAAKAVGRNALDMLEFLEDSKEPFEKTHLLTRVIESKEVLMQKPMILWMLLKGYPTDGALDTAVTYANQNDKPLNLLLKNGVKAQPKALMTAIKCHDFQTVEKLVNYGADCNSAIDRTNVGAFKTHPRTPLGAAVLNYNPAIFSFVITRSTLDKRIHGYISGQPAGFAALLHVSNSKKDIKEHLKLLVAKKLNLGKKADECEVESDMSLG